MCIRDSPIPNAPAYADLRNRGLTCLSVAGTEKGLEKARSQGLRIFEPVSYTHLDVKNELKIMCVLFTEEVGGILDMEFDEEGNLLFKSSADEGEDVYKRQVYM